MVRRKNNSYSVEFKEQAVRMYLDGEGSYKELSERLGIKSETQLIAWVRKKRAGQSLDNKYGKTSRIGKSSPPASFSSAEEELIYVKAELELVKKLYRSRFGKEWGANSKNNSLP